VKLKNNQIQSTVSAWKGEISEFLESITRGKESADADIAQALFHRAKGYSHPAALFRCLEFSEPIKESRADVSKGLASWSEPDHPGASLLLPANRTIRARERSGFRKGASHESGPT
jgi:hypothetical protein